MKKILLLNLVIFFGISCSVRHKDANHIEFLLDDKFNINDSLIDLRIINNSDLDYFIILDKNNNDYLSFTNKLNSSIHVKTIVMNDLNDTIYKTDSLKIIKQGDIDTALKQCLDEDYRKAKLCYERLERLEDRIIIKGKSQLVVKVNFKLKDIICNHNFSYLLRKNEKYFIRCSYQLESEIVNKVVLNDVLARMDSLEIYPYFNKIVSNKSCLEFNK